MRYSDALAEIVTMAARRQEQKPRQTYKDKSEGQSIRRFINAHDNDAADDNSSCTDHAFYDNKLNTDNKHELMQCTSLLTNIFHPFWVWATFLTQANFDDVFLLDFVSTYLHLLCTIHDMINT